MISYILRRLILLPVTLFGMSLLVFSLLLVLGPEKRASFYLTDVPKNDAVLEGIIRRNGFREPVPLQYFYWLAGKPDPDTGEPVGGILRGQLGFSRFQYLPVAELIRLRFPATLELTLYSIPPFVLLGVLIGVIAAVRHNRWFDQAARLFSLIGYSLPGFLLGILLLMIFYADLGWFPSGRMSEWVRLEVLAGSYVPITGLLTFDAPIRGRWDILLDAWRHLILPVITLSLISLAAVMRITRSAMLEVLRQEYIVTARAKGQTEPGVIRRHALPNALIPVATYCGMLVAASLGGVVITESVFDFPGLGYVAAEAAARWDIPTVLALTMLAGAFLIIVNLLVDILYAALDPRIRLQ